jgi:LIVCS family branched-chain amino acid:cation transporter
VELILKQTMTRADLLGLGFMTFAFFLGAGNIIFPPMAGYLAGENMSFAMLGFLITAVGLPLATILSIAFAGGGLLTMTRMLPAWAGMSIAIATYIIIGPAFATPRTGLVTYEMAVKPFIGSFDSQIMLTCFVIFYFALTLFLSLNQGKLLDAVGKILTPVLVLLLAVLGIAVLVAPQGSIPPVSADYIAHPVVKGLLEGYNTMDTFGALMFGMLIIDVLKSRGIENVKQQTRYLAVASVIAASGLALVYIALFQLGGTAGGIIANPQNGGELVAAYVALLFGPMGSVVLAAIVGLACLTTSVGLTSACADFFHTLWPRYSYKQCAAVIVILCAIVANVGLTQLLVISIPVLVAIYPVAIALVAVTFMRSWFFNQSMAFRLVLGVALLFGCLDGIKAAGVDLSALNFLPLFELGLAWLLPTLAAIVVSLLWRVPEQAAVAAE